MVPKPHRSGDDETRREKILRLPHASDCGWSDLNLMAGRGYIPDRVGVAVSKSLGEQSPLPASEGSRVMIRTLTGKVFWDRLC